MISRVSFVVPALVAATLGVVAPTAAATTGSAGGLSVTPSATLTTWSGTSVGSLNADDAATRGDLTVLGMRGDSSACAGGAAGAVQILRRSGHTWVAEQRIAHPQPLDRSPSGRTGVWCTGEFGTSVSTDGTRVAVAARFRSGDTDTVEGAVYVYDRDGAGRWTLTGTVPAPVDVALTAVAVSGDRLAVAGTAAGAGARIVTYTRGQGGWTAEGELPGAAPLALDGATIAYSTGTRGPVRIAERTATGWTPTHTVLERTVTGPTAGADPGGVSGMTTTKVLLDAGSLTVAGRVFRDTGAADTVQLYTRGAGSLAYDAQLGDPLHPDEPSSFGASGSVSRDGDTVVVGAAAAETGRRYGAAYVFTRDEAGTWALRRTITPTTPAESEFGSRVAVAGSALGIVAGAVDTSWGDLFSHDATTGGRTASANGSATGAGHRLGWQGDVDGDVAAALTLEHTVAGDALAYSAGALYVFERAPSGWARAARLVSPGTAQGGEPGLRTTLRGPVVVSGDSVYVTGQTATSGGLLRDTLLRFTRAGGSWAYADQVPMPDAATPVLTDVAVAGDQMILATASYTSGNGVWTSRRVDGAWSRPVFLSSPGSGVLRVGTTADGSVAAVAGRQDAAVVVYRRGSTGWQLSDTVTLPSAPSQPVPRFDEAGHLAVVDSAGAPRVSFFAPDPAAPGRFVPEGSYLSTEDVADFGAGSTGLGAGFLVSRTDGAGITHVEILGRTASGWARTGELPAGARRPADGFGELLATDGRTLLVGAPGTDSPAGRQSGEVHLFALADGPAPPAPPTGVTTAVGDRSATLTWVRPAGDGGSPILGYTVTASPGGRTCSTTGADQLSCTVTGLVNGVSYAFAVVARNAAGSSTTASPGPGEPTVVGVPPSPVTVLAPEPDPADGTRVTLRWLAAETDPGLPVLGYRATAEPGGRSCSTDGALTCTITGLTPGADTTFTVVAINGVGTSGTAAPQPPSEVKVTAGRWTEARVAWRPPTSSGGSPVSRYAVSATPTGTDAGTGAGEPASCTTTGALTCTLTGLVPGAAYTVTATATTSRGTSRPSAPVPYVPPRDTTAPTVTGTPDRAPDVTVDGTGWWTAPVTVTWAAEDGESGVAGGGPAPTVMATDGRAPATSAPVCDAAGNCATGSYPLRIDGHGPAVTITGVRDRAQYTRGSVPGAACTADDALTGVDGACTVTVSGGNANGVGSFTVRATARDGAGNRTTVEATYQVLYPWDGFDQPIDDVAHEVSATTSVFKAGRTVPVKFTLEDAAGRVITPVAAPLWVAPSRGAAVTLPVDETVYAEADDSGTVYQLRDGHWQYNWKTDRSMAGSYWRIGVRLDDGSVRYVTLALQ